MPGLYEQDAMWVDDSDDTQDFLLDMVEESVQYAIDEDDAMSGEEFLMVEEEEDTAPDMRVPGSDVQYVEDVEQPKEEKVTNWADDGDHRKFLDYLNDKLTKIPRHSGETVPGCERAKAYLKSVDNEISKAMRSDLNGHIDEQEVDRSRKGITDMMERLDKQIKKLQGTKRAALDVQLFSSGHCKKCASAAPMWHDKASDRMVCMHCEAEELRTDEQLEKNASTPRLNVYMTPFERAVVGIMINSKVSAGRNIEETYEKLKNKYNFTPREELAIQQLIADHGYPVYKDRGLLNEPSDPAAGDGMEWQTNYQA